MLTLAPADSHSWKPITILEPVIRIPPRQSPQIPAWFYMKSPMKTCQCGIVREGPICRSFNFQTSSRSIAILLCETVSSYSKQPPASANANDLCPALSSEQPASHSQLVANLKLIDLASLLFFYAPDFEAPSTCLKNFQRSTCRTHGQFRRTRARPTGHLQRFVLGRDILVHSLV
jgi:hypothetical protein